MDTTETQGERAKESPIPIETDLNKIPRSIRDIYKRSRDKQHTKQIAKIPKRARPKDRYALAMDFLAAVLAEMESKTMAMSFEHNSRYVREWFANFCANARLRGKERDAVWRIVRAQIMETRGA